MCIFNLLTESRIQQEQEQYRPEGIAIFIGCDYFGTKHCYQDAYRLSLLATTQPIFEHNVRLYTDHDYSGAYLLNSIKLAILEKPKYLWISLSGSGNLTTRTLADNSLSLGNNVYTLQLDDMAVLELLQQIPTDTKVLFTSDNCHSGTVLNLTYRHQYRVGDTFKTTRETYKTCKASVICLSTTTHFPHERPFTPLTSFTDALCKYCQNKILTDVLLIDLMCTLPGIAITSTKPVTTLFE